MFDATNRTMHLVFAHRLVRTLVSLSIAAAIPACVIVPIPPVWDIANPIRCLGEIDVGTTTKAEVIDIFGEAPSVQIGGDDGNPQGSRLNYSGNVDRMSFCWAFSAGYAAGGAGCNTDDENWWVRYFFDENDIAIRVESSETEKGPDNRGRQG